MDKIVLKTSLIVDHFISCELLLLQIPWKLHGKRVNRWLNEKFTYLIIGDSHVARLSQWMKKNGVDSISVSGGGVRHVREILEMLQYGKGRYSAIMLAVGGNDLCMGMNPAVLVEKISEMVRLICEKNPGCIAVTTPILPRIPDRRELVKSGEWFLQMVTSYDNLLQKAGYWHHNWCSDLFVAEDQGKITLPRLELYALDKVHLNNRGVALYWELFKFCLDSVNFLKWSERKRFPVGEDGFRTVFWSF